MMSMYKDLISEAENVFKLKTSLRTLVTTKNPATPKAMTKASLNASLLAKSQKRESNGRFSRGRTNSSTKKRKK